jgi:hypothetical protein
MTQPLSEELPSQQDNQRQLELEQQLREAITADRFFEQDTGRLWTKLAIEEITRITREITSDKFRKDPTGYNNALSDLHAYQRMLKKMQIAGSPQRREKIKERLDIINNV